MGRIRTIKPEFPQSESMGRVSRDARLLFILLWTLVDDSGRTRAASRMLASLLFPYDDDAPRLIGGWLDELDHVGCITRYEVEGDAYLEVCKWASHQKIDRPSQSKFPSPREGSRVFDEGSRKIALDQGPRTKDQGPPIYTPHTNGEAPAAPPEQHAAAPARAKRVRLSMSADKPPEDVMPDTWRDWLTLRHAKKLPVTETVLEQMRREAKRADLCIDDVLELCIQNSWAGFKAGWLDSNRQPIRRQA